MGTFMIRIKIKIQSVGSHHHLNYILKSTRCVDFRMFKIISCTYLTFL